MKLTYPFYTIDRPDLSHIDQGRALGRMVQDREKISLMAERANTPIYLPWDVFRYKHDGADLHPEEAWFLLRLLRDQASVKTPIRSESGEYFRWMRLRGTDQHLHRMDSLRTENVSGMIRAVTKNQSAAHGLIEEAIASSQLEGAHTTRAQAKKMLLEHRPPRNNSEKMILNNYLTIRSIEENYRGSTLSLNLLLDLHRQLTEGTDIAKQDIGRLRRDDDRIHVAGHIGSQEYTTHIPPREAFVQSEMPRLFTFANEQKEEEFMHPMVKAILLHFWIGYLHPFTDGNGRLARALFYWFLLRNGYRMIAYVPISTILKRAPSQYAMAYIYSEQDSLDLTYFYDFHMRKLLQALDEFERYVEGTFSEIRVFDAIAGRRFQLNDRQKELIRHFVGDPHFSTTIASYRDLYKVTRQTAAKDLRELEHDSFVQSQREGQIIRFYAGAGLERFRKELL